MENEQKLLWLDAEYLDATWERLAPPESALDYSATQEESAAEPSVDQIRLSEISVVSVDFVSRGTRDL